jgi:DNA helicase-2/ATP-dependent DNA helicase PcrA
MRNHPPEADAKGYLQERAVGHDAGPLLLVGEAGTGKTEALARRLARLAESGTEPQEALLLASTRATAQRLRARVEALLSGSYEELWVGTWQAIGERLLRERSEEAGLDPFFDVLSPAERLAMLLDRLDELPLRQHEIRGNPAGLLARLLERIDAIKAGADAPGTELADLCAAHDRILAAAGSLDRGDVFLILSRLLEERAEIRAALADRFRFVMVDELEETTTAQRAILAALCAANPNHVYALEGESAGDASAGLRGWYSALHPGGDVLVL